MTYQELMDKTNDIQMEYEYIPMKNSPIHVVLHKRSSRDLFGDLSCESNVIGMDDGRFFGVQCLKTK